MIRARRILLCLLALIITGCANTNQDAQNKYRLRFDGVYQSTSNDGEYFFRFFEDRTVLSVGTSRDVTVADITKWFDKDSGKDVAEGVFSINAGSINFLTTNSSGSVSFSGHLLNGELTLKWFSYINSRTGAHTAKFVPFPLNLSVDSTSNFNTNKIGRQGSARLGVPADLAHAAAQGR